MIAVPSLSGVVVAASQASTVTASVPHASGGPRRVEAEPLRLDRKLDHRAERLGYHSVWTAEAYGTDAVTPLAWIAATTTKINVGTAIMQMPARTPAMTAMTAMTLDQLSRRALPARPRRLGPAGRRGLARRSRTASRSRARASTSRSCARSCAARAARAPRRALRHPVPRPGATGLGKPLKLIRARCAPTSRSTSRRSARRTSRSRPRSPTAGCRSSSRPERFAEVFGRQPRRRAGRASTSRRPSRSSSATTSRPCRDALKPLLALYIGGMGARGKNFYNDLACRYGFEAEAATDPGPLPRRQEARGDRRGARTSSSTRSRWSARASASPTGWRRGASAASRRCSCQTHDVATLRRWRSSRSDGRPRALRPDAARSRSSPAAAAGSAARWRRGSPRRAPTSSSARARPSAASRQPPSSRELGVRAIGLALRRPRAERDPGGRRPRTSTSSAGSTSSSTTPAPSWGAAPEDMPLEGWQKVIDVNLTGAFLFAQAVGRVMIEQGEGGKIVNIASVAGSAGAPPEIMNSIPYNASKGGVDRVHARPRRASGRGTGSTSTRSRPAGSRREMSSYVLDSRRRAARPYPARPLRRRRTTSRAQSSSSPRPPPTTSPATRSSSTAASPPGDRCPP